MSKPCPIQGRSKGWEDSDLGRKRKSGNWSPDPRTALRRKPVSRQQISPPSKGVGKELKQIKHIFLFSKEETQTNIDILKVIRLPSPQENTNQNHNDMLRNQDFNTEYTKDVSDGPISPDIRKLRQEDRKFKASEWSLKARLGCRDRGQRGQSRTSAIKVKKEWE